MAGCVRGFGCSGFCALDRVVRPNVAFVVSPNFFDQRFRSHSYHFALIDASVVASNDVAMLPPFLKFCFERHTCIQSELDCVDFRCLLWSTWPWIGC